MRTNANRREWLKTAKRVALLVVTRASQFSELCPRFSHLDADGKHDVLKRIAGLDSELDALADALLELEANGKIGSKAVTGTNGDRTLVVVVAMLVAARLATEVACEARSVADVMSLVSGRDPATSLAVRGFFRSDGILHRHVHLLLPSESLDACRVSLKESALAKCLGIQVDKAAALYEFNGESGRWSR